MVKAPQFQYNEKRGIISFFSAKFFNPSVIGAVRYFTVLKLSCLIRLIVVSFLPLDDKIIF